MVLLALMSAAAVEWEMFALEVRVTLMAEAEAEARLELAMLLAAAY